MENEISQEKKFEMERVEVHPESLSDQYSYVVHGALLVCQWGSRTSRLVVPLSHGTYLHDMPVMTVTDCRAEANIQGFGYCMNPENPNRIAKIKEIKENVKKSGGFLSKVMHFFGMEKEVDGSDLENNILIPCTPVFAAGTEWEPGAGEIRYQINGKCALRVDCQIECIHCGGRIQMIEDGQEDAAAEQSTERFDAKDWQEGDALPPPTQKNLEEAKREVAQLEQRIEKCEDGIEKEQLQAELDEKKELYHTIKETKEILEDIHIKQMFETPVSDPIAVVEAMEESGELQKRIDSGYFKETKTLEELQIEQAMQQVTMKANAARVAQGEKEIDLNVLKAKAAMAEELRESSERYEALEQTKQEVLAQYNKGTPCKKLTNERVQEELTEISNHAYEIADSLYGPGGNDFLTNPENAGQEGYDIFTNPEFLSDLYREPVEQNVLPDDTLIYQNGVLVSKGDYRQAIDTEVREYLKNK